ncbi:PAS domain-containing protein [Pseudoroseomonas wenyumeiae]
MVADYEGHLLRVSPSWSRLLGMQEADLLAIPYARLMHPEDIGPVRTALQNMRRTGQAMRFENRLRDAQGGWRWFAWTLSPEPGGERLFGVGRDVTVERSRPRRGNGWKSNCARARRWRRWGSSPAASRMTSTTC